MAEKTYPVTKDGVQFEVKATSPEEAAAKARAIDVATVARVIARNGTTRVFERPNGQRYVVSPNYSSLDPAAVEKALAGMSASEISRTGIDESIIAANPLAARGVQFLRGIPAAGAYLDEVMGAVLGPEAGTAVRAASGAMERQRPMETMGLNLAGGVTAAAGALAAAPAAITGALGAIAGTGPRIAQMARLAGTGLVGGTTEGGIYGYGEGTTPQERGNEAAVGAAFGGVTGGLLGAATPIAEAGVRNVMSLFRRSDIATIAATLGISANAARVIKNTFEMGGDMQTAIARVEQAGAQGIIGDAGEAAQALLDATAASGPAGSAAVREPLNARMSEVSENLDTGLTGLLGQPAEGPVTAVREIMDASRAQRTSAYDAAYTTPIDYASPAGQNIENIVLNRVEPSILMSAIREANAEMADLGLTNQQIMARILPDGSVQFVEMPNVHQLDELKKGLRKLATEAKNSEGMVVFDTPESLRYARQANDLGAAITDATGGAQGPYAAATRIGGDTIQERNAYELGEALLSPRTRVEAVRLELGPNPSDAQVAAAKRGLRTRINQIVGDVKRIPSDPNLDARQALATLREMSSDNAREKIRRVMGVEANDVFKMLDEAMIAAETRAATSVNSRTAIRQSTQENVNDLTSAGAVGEALRGEPVNTTKRLIQGITGYTDEFTVQQRQRVYQDLAKALTEKRGPDAVVALRVLDAAMRGQALTDAQTDMLAKLVTTALVSGSVPTAGREAQAQFGQTGAQ
jgi:hypothetical protein